MADRKYNRSAWLVWGAMLATAAHACVAEEPSARGERTPTAPPAARQAGDPTKADAPRRPNVLFIAIDDLRDWLHYLGPTQPQTPNFDRLARMGVSFTRSYALSTVCNPSRTATLTGMRPGSTGVYGNTTDWRAQLPGVVTIPGHFRANGYYVAGAGKIFHGKYLRAADWDEYSRAGEELQAEERARRPGSTDRDAFTVGRNVFRPLDGDDSMMPDYHIAQYVCEQLARQHDRPFFLACGFHKPHPLFECPRKYFDLYPLDQIELPRVLDSDLDDVGPIGRQWADPAEHAEILAAGKWKHLVQAYLACITFCDAQLGRVLDALEQSPAKDNTLVVLWSDHGWHLGEKQHWHKFTLWEESARAPLLWVVPGLTRAGGVCERPVDFSHIFPTLCDLCGLETPSQVEGLSIRPLLADPATAWEPPAVTTYKRGNHAVRDERWRYIRYADGFEELYDHEADPLEWKNLAADPALADVKRALAFWLPEKNVPEGAREPLPAKKQAKKAKK